MDDCNNKSFEEIINKGDYSKAISAINNCIALNPDKADFFMARGDLYYKMQKFALALNDYNKAFKKDPDNKNIKTKIEFIKDILKFQNLDIYASTNLNKDPWLDD
ncbi:MAG TPA: tetratricopeptide repeat protein [Bacteroidales bacterium]|nr:tetratricopeptide repeat protein [Bacteroidales bacterium]